MPMNFVALGDASLYVNPAYGHVPLPSPAHLESDIIPAYRQGFAKATLNGIALNSVLHTARVESGVPVVSARYFAKSAEWMSPLWCVSI
jgi:hypothetical protein